MPVKKKVYDTQSAWFYKNIFACDGLDITRRKLMIKEFIYTIKHKVFRCDPKKNTACSKYGCYINGGPCKRTCHKEYYKRFLGIPIIFVLLLTCNLNVLAAPHHDTIWNSLVDEERKNLDTETIACACGMEKWEFELLARVIEAESDRSSNIEGKIMIAATILNRVDSSYFPNSIYAVLTQSGQFETVNSSGNCSVSATETSIWAIVEAQRALAEGTIPHNVLFFNCVGYNYGDAYGYFGGNYFMTYGG